MRSSFKIIFLCSLAPLLHTDLRGVKRNPCRFGLRKGGRLIWRLKLQVNYETLNAEDRKVDYSFN